ncbi:hypothetical protein BJX96DRAFT_157112 [Aspergillus floccosus]
MDLFLYNPTYQICLYTAPGCRYAVSPTTLETHRRIHHLAYPDAATPALRQAILSDMLPQSWIDRFGRYSVSLPAESLPVLGLR